MGPFGKKQVDQLAAFTGTVICYSIASALNIIYITDWKAVSMYIPFYGGKFFPKAPPKKDCE